MGTESFETNLLIEKLKTGDDECWDKIVRNYGPKVIGYLLSLQSPLPYEELQDITNETFLSFLKSIHAFRGDCSIGTYLIIIAEHKAYTAIRKHNQKARLETDIDKVNPEHTASNYFIDIVQDQPSDSKDTFDPDNAEEIFVKELSFGDKLSQLKKNCRTLLALRYYAGMKTLDIYRYLLDKEPGLENMQPGVIDTRIHRCVNKLRDIMEKSGFDPLWA